MKENEVVLGLSGGIDSAAAAILLKQKGMKVHALYFDVLKDGDLNSRKRAEKLAFGLGIDFKYINCYERFEKLIIEPFCLSYMGGCTPMPCIVCNPYIKWFLLKEYADELNVKWIASGHYSRIKEIDGYYYVQKAANERKDQSYMLAQMDQEYLSRMIFPLGDIIDKEITKEIVKKYGLEFPNSIKESQDICFIKTNYKDFLKEKGYKSKAGNFVDLSGNVIGKHNSYSDFTIGQGKGFGMGFNKKVYVKSIDSDTGNVVLCDDKDLYTNDIPITICSFAKYGRIEYLPKEYENQSFDVKIRYAAKPSKALLTSKNCEEGIANLHFDDSQRAPAYGQYAVFYKDDIVMGCGIIS